MTGIRSSKRTLIRKSVNEDSQMIPRFPDDPDFACISRSGPAPAKIAERGGLELPPRGVNYFAWEQQ